MENFRFRLILSVAMLGFVVFISCEKSKGCGEVNVSKAGSNDSHNFGNNCMKCHTYQGEGKGCFYVAGSVKNAALTNNASGGQVLFYTEPNGAGSLKHSMDIDSKGNFHTTESFDVTGLYPAIKTSSGTLYMGASLVSGSCNNCHGSSTSSLYTF